MPLVELEFPLVLPVLGDLANLMLNPVLALLRASRDAGHPRQRVSYLQLDEIERVPADGVVPDFEALVHFEGWRFLAPSAEGAVASLVTEVQGKWTVAALTTGPGVQSLLQAAMEMASRVEAIPGVHDNFYQVDVLRVPGLLTEVFRVKLLPRMAQRLMPGAAQFILPYYGQLSQLRPWETLSPTEFLRRIRGPATLRMDYYRTHER